MRALSLAVSRCKWKPCFRDASRLYPSLTPAAFFSAASRAVRTAPCLNSVSLPIPQSPRFLHSSSRCKTAEISRTRQVEDVATVRDAKQNLSMGERILKSIGWMAGFYSRKSVLSRSALDIYKSCVDEIDYEAFFKVCKLPDSLHSWFLIAQLHIWLLMVRLKREGDDGRHLIRELVSTFWYDVKERPNALGVHSRSLVAKSMREMSAEFNGLIIAYEEGLLLSDKALAAAIWRNLIHDKSATDPVQLEVMVRYIRSQVQHMDSLDTEELLSRGKISLLPFNPHSTTC